jgi:hypothetical protein
LNWRGMLRAQYGDRRAQTGEAYSGACWIIARGIGHLACGNFVLH